jgi:hypothetical protein
MVARAEDARASWTGRDSCPTNLGRLTRASRELKAIRIEVGSEKWWPRFQKARDDPASFAGAGWNCDEIARIFDHGVADIGMRLKELVEFRMFT